MNPYVFQQRSMSSSCVSARAAPAIIMDARTTRCGEIAVDPLGAANGTRTRLGTFLPTLAKNGWVRKTDRVMPSRSPCRRVALNGSGRSPTRLGES